MTSARALTALAVLAVACESTPPRSVPVPLAMTPSQGTGLAPLAVEISGRGLEPRVSADFSAGDGELDARFTAELAPAAGGSSVTLERVTLARAGTLAAIVPAGVPSGAYHLSVTGPHGRTGVLAQAFRVVTSAENVASFRLEVLDAPRAGVPFAVSLTAVDAQGLTVDGFEGSVALTDVTATASPASLGPFVRGRLQAQVAVAALAAGDRLTVQDALGHAGTSDPFDVVAGPPVAIVFPGPPVSAATGACSPRVDVELRDATGHAAIADVAVAAQLQSSPSGLAFFSDAGCAAPSPTLTLAPGASRAGFHFRGATPGAVTLRVVPATVPSATQAAIVSP